MTKVKEVFEDWGKVIDVYIAKKRNKSGRIFGFVRFTKLETKNGWKNNSETCSSDH